MGCNYFLIIRKESMIYVFSWKHFVPCFKYLLEINKKNQA